MINFDDCVYRSLDDNIALYQKTTREDSPWITDAELTASVATWLAEYARHLDSERYGNSTGIFMMWVEVCEAVGVWARKAVEAFKQAEVPL